MRRFILTGFVLFSSLNSLWGMEDFDPNEHWGEMGYQARSRAEWFKETTGTLGDEKLSFKERAVLAKKISSIDPSQIVVPKGLKPQTQKEMQFKIAVQRVQSDMIYGWVYWDFLARTLEFYSNASNNTKDIRKLLLPHLVRELNCFESYAIGDLKNNKRNSYYNKEFFINRDIVEECKILAQHYKIEIENGGTFVDEETKEHISVSDLKDKNLNITFSTDDVKSSDQEPYFMEQLICYRKKQNDRFPDLKDPKLKVFQTYILPTTDPTLLTDLNQAKEEEKPKAEKKIEKPTTEKKPRSKSKKPSKNPKNKGNKTKKKSNSSHQPIQSKDESNSENEDSEQEDILEEPLLVEKEKPKPSLSSVVSINPAVIEKVSPPLKKRLDIRDIYLKVEQRDSSIYTFNGERFDFEQFIRGSFSSYEQSFLREIKSLTRLSPDKKDKLPNLAQIDIHFHVIKNNESEMIPISLKEIFMSGGKFFERDGLNFKKDNHLVNGWHDIFTEKERNAVPDFAKRGIPLGIALEKRLRQEIVGGPWAANCLDSEAILLLYLKDRLPQILKKKVVSGSKDHPVEIKGVVLGISSYRDCCPKCQKLIQGFQHALADIILGFKVPNLTLDRENFSTLAIAYGHIRPQVIRSDNPVYPLLKGQPNLGKGHTLICTQKYQ